MLVSLKEFNQSLKGLFAKVRICEYLLHVYVSVESPECSSNRTVYGSTNTPRCPTYYGQYIVPFMMGFYMLFSNILLINLVIAMFR